MAKTTKRETDLKFGDEVIYKNKRCVILETFTNGPIVYYHLFGPKVGVYTAYEDEVEKTGHSKEADALMDALSKEILAEAG